MRLIASADESWGIGLDGDLLLSTRADMAHLRELTMGHVLLMGGRTFRSLPNGALPGRVNVVLTRTKLYATPGEGCIGRLRIAHSPEEALAILAEHPSKEHFLFGGGEIYRLFLQYCTRADITRYAPRPGDSSRRADTFMPRLDLPDGWALTGKSPMMEEDGLQFCFESWEYNKS
ncbi:MAG: dihydrofolate reductase [Oscillospiraceae bacterium]|jgi:dihydrofolate reductase|nr:dihydrofolate reductase [Oscillospiraceae bacterium]